MDLKELKIEKNVATVEIIINEKEIDIHRNHVVDEMISQVTVKGFRQGKAPKSVAINSIDPNKLTDHLLNHILNEGVTASMKEFKYRLLGRPVLESIDTKDTTGWKFQINFPLYPEVKLGDYKKLFTKTVKAKKATSKKDDTKDSKEAKPEEDKMSQIYETLLKNINVDIAPSVIDEEVNYSLERLEGQAKTLNLSLNDYLKAVNKSLEQVKEEYAKSAQDSLKLDLILLEIAKEEKIDTPMDEVEKMAEASQVPSSQFGQIKAILDRRKTIELLSKI